MQNNFKKGKASSLMCEAKLKFARQRMYNSIFKELIGMCLKFTLGTETVMLLINISEF